MPTHRRRYGSPQQSAAPRRWFRTAMTIGLSAIVALLLGGTVLAIWVSQDLPDPDKLTDRHVAQSTKIFDRTGEHLLYEIYVDQKRTLVELSDIPKHLVNGLIATEDTKFYEHKGVRPLSILRSVVNGLTSRSRVGGGASTLTQQLVKNAILVKDNPYIRKPKEIILSIQLEQKYTKDQILKIYFNEIPYGSTNYGVESAAQSYFGKHVSELNLQESATLAGFPKAPSTYLKNREALKNRRDFVLQRMADEGYITREEAEAAQKEPLTVKEERYTNITAPHFVEYVRDELKDQYGEHLVNTGGLKVITSLDWDKQRIAEEAVSSSAKVFTEAKANNAALLAMDPKTGQILAMVGSRDYYDESIDGNFNVATAKTRQPGSSLKPIIYAAAFEKGYTPETLLFDALTDFDLTEGVYMPKNYSLKEYGPVTMRTALQGSLNITAVQTLYLVGIPGALDFAKKMGYTTLTGRGELTIVLGGEAVQLLEHVGAYSVFANNGKKQPTTSILKVEESNGDVLYEWELEKGEQVITPELAATMSNVLSDDAARAYVFGAGGSLTLKGRPVAAKTGTSQDYADAWTIGYTPSLAAGVWAGNTDFKQKMSAGFGGSRIAGTIWNYFMREATKNTPVESFPTPPPNDATKPILRGSTGGITLPINRLNGRIATSSTPPEDIVEQTFIPPHSILHYVIKDDPRGPVPQHPEQDPQYQSWEQAILAWAERMQAANPDFRISFEEPPTIYDEPGSFDLAPSLTVLAPAPDSTITSRQIVSQIDVSAPRGVARVRYRLDGKLIDTVTTPPFALNFFAGGVANGPHILTIVAEDDSNNQARVDIPFTLQVGDDDPFVAWIGNSLTLPTNEDVRVLLLSAYKPNDIKSVTIYQERNTGDRSTVTTITNFSDLTNNQIPITWKVPKEPGTWRLTGEMETKNGGIQTIDTLTITLQ